MIIVLNLPCDLRAVCVHVSLYALNNFFFHNSNCNYIFVIASCCTNELCMLSALFTCTWACVKTCTGLYCSASSILCCPCFLHCPPWPANSCVSLYTLQNFHWIVVDLLIALKFMALKWNSYNPLPSLVPMLISSSWHWKSLGYKAAFFQHQNTPRSVDNLFQGT